MQLGIQGDVQKWPFISENCKLEKGPTDKATFYKPQPFTEFIKPFIRFKLYCCNVRWCLQQTLGVAMTTIEFQP